MKIKVCIVDDHILFLESLALLISNMKEVELVYKTDNAQDMLRNLAFYECDLLITDFQMPEMSGLDLTKLVREKYPSVAVLMLTMIENLETIKAALKAGVQGYILKNAKKTDFEKAIYSLAKGEKYFYPAVYDKLKVSNTEEVILSDREIEVIKLIAEENSSAAIADKLCISLNTVETHRKNIFRKTGVKNGFGLLKYALQHQLIEL